MTPKLVANPKNHFPGFFFAQILIFRCLHRAAI